MQESPESADEAHVTRRNAEHAGRDSAPLHSTFERRKAQADERPQRPRPPIDSPEIEPQRQVDVARRPEFADHPVVVDAVDAGMPRSCDMRRMALVTPSRFHQLTRSGLNSSRIWPNRATSVIWRLTTSRL